MQSLRILLALFVRGFKQCLRPYAALMPEFVIPIFFFIVSSSAFSGLRNLPGFTFESYMQFYAPVALLTSIFVSSGSTGIEVVTDISSGYMDRLFLAPIKRWHIVFAKLAAVGVKSALLTGFMMILILIFGAPFQGGLIGMAFVLLFAFIFGMGWSGIGLLLAFTTKNPRVVQSAFIFFFPFSFITTAQLPLDLLEGWYKTAVQINPVTYILEGMRAVLTRGEIGATLFTGLAVAVGFAVVTLSIATLAFQRSVANK
ncbi:ABC transporter permease [Candidatus Acetothermia bacterium]|nr:ABC transporter permease [Candidatus Acetothermia bacterium]MBI3643473.1 ABC transporter permease [Candidatus Acetothermia bacterium]